jgi:glycosyltransferase involved in cell wall biosynthesis
VSDLKQESASPLLTVAMPIYNAGKYLRLAVLSIVKQSFSNWELLIIDDGSTDDALSEIADIDDPRIIVLKDGKNKGLAERLNESIDLARGQYFARMDQDDVSYAERFMQQLSFLNKNPEVELLAVRAITIDENDEVTGLFPSAMTHTEICAKPWRGFYLPHPTWMGKIEWFRRHRYTVPGPYFCEDQELLLRSYPVSQFATLDEIQFAYRIRSTINWTKLAKTRKAVFAAQRQHFSIAKRWDFVFLAALMYVAKLSADVLKRIKNAMFQPVRRVIDDTLVSTWRMTLNDLLSNKKTSL